jgi:hypothetical protein
VSLYLAVNEDKFVEQVIAEALDETMATVEARMETKVRKGYQHDNRVSPNILFTARAGLSMGSPPTPREAITTIVSPKIARVFSELLWKAKLSAVDIAGGCLASKVR